MLRGKHKPLRTPATNRKVWISGALNFKTGRLHWVCGERRNDELFIKLLDKLRRTYRAATRSCILPQTTTQAI
jgi:putative transposase